MLLSHYLCTGCREKLELSPREALHRVGAGPLDGTVAGKDLIRVPVRPAWCKRCNAVCVVEDISPLRRFEAAYGAVRAGRVVDYPAETEGWDPVDAEAVVAALLRWRMTRRHPARALCCGGSDFQCLDVAQPLIWHLGCEYGVIEPEFFVLGSYNGPGPGVLGPANIPLYSSEGERIGLLTWCDRHTEVWQVEPAAYPPVEED